MIRPEYLKKGDGIAVVSPSYRMEEDALSSAIDIVRGWGFEPVCSPNLNRGGDVYAGTAAERAEDLGWALNNPDVTAVICSRGGYGALHLIDRVPASRFAVRPKWLVGYSDITTLHAMSVAGGVMSIHGQMLSSLGREGSEESSSALVSLLTGDCISYRFDSCRYNVPGSASGMLLGGNFITLNALFGTSCDFLSGQGDVILFIEEVEESMHAIDRLFNVLLRHRNFGCVKGLVFGQFTGCAADLPYGSVEEMLSEYLPALGIPVAFGFPAGHGAVNLPFIEGAAVELTVGPSGTEMKYLETAAADEGPKQ